MRRPVHETLLALAAVWRNAAALAVCTESRSYARLKADRYASVGIRARQRHDRRLAHA